MKEARFEARIPQIEKNAIKSYCALRGIPLVIWIRRQIQKQTGINADDLK